MKDDNDRARAGQDLDPEEGTTSPGDPWGEPLALTAASLTGLPPAERWLINWPGGDGCLPQHTVGILASDGGLGKTRAMIELACCLAHGNGSDSHPGPRDWLAPTRPASGGGFPINAQAYGTRTLLLLAEEREPNVRRRLHWAVRDTGTDPHLVARNLVAYPFGDRADLALTRPSRETGSTVATAVVGLLRRVIEERGPFGLVILDPLSAFASSETEVSSEAATKLFAVLAQLAGDDGPTILLTHHVTKLSTREGETGQAAIRGSSGLVNRARWAALMTPAGQARPKGEPGPPPMISVVKANDARRGRVLLEEDARARGRFFVSSVQSVPSSVSSNGAQSTNGTGAKRGYLDT